MLNDAVRGNTKHSCFWWLNKLLECIYIFCFWIQQSCLDFEYEEPRSELRFSSSNNLNINQEEIKDNEYGSRINTFANQRFNSEDWSYFEQGKNLISILKSFTEFIILNFYCDRLRSNKLQ